MTSSLLGYYGTSYSAEIRGYLVRLGIGVGIEARGRGSWGGWGRRKGYGRGSVGRIGFMGIAVVLLEYALI